MCFEEPRQDDGGVTVAEPPAKPYTCPVCKKVWEQSGAASEGKVRCTQCGVVCSPQIVVSCDSDTANGLTQRQVDELVQKAETGKESEKALRVIGVTKATVAGCNLNLLQRMREVLGLR